MTSGSIVVHIGREVFLGSSEKLWERANDQVLVFPTVEVHIPIDFRFQISSSLPVWM